MRWRTAVTVTTFVAMVVTSGCTEDASPRLLDVPSSFSTIQSAVDDASPGDIIEISPGTYRESVIVTTNGIVIRGRDRNQVILDGGYRMSNGIYVAADGVRVENLTVRAFTQNGVIFSGIDRSTREEAGNEITEYGTPGASLVGYEVRWLTAHNNGLYGVYAFAASDGLIVDTYVSGHPDSGIYIGQCRPCRAIVRNVSAELNAIGYYGTNASGDVYVIDSNFRRNRLGIAPNSQDAEALAPQAENVVAGNLVENNDDPTAPVIPEGFFGGGIVIGGGTKNLVLRNRVTGHDYVGIGVLDFNSYAAENNIIRENVSIGNRMDLAYLPNATRSSLGNCFVGNDFVTSTPRDIENRLRCNSTPTTVKPEQLQESVSPPSVDYKSIPWPAPQPSMPKAEFVRPAGVTKFSAPDLDTIVVP